MTAPSPRYKYCFHVLKYESDHGHPGIEMTRRAWSPEFLAQLILAGKRIPCEAAFWSTPILQTFAFTTLFDRVEAMRMVMAMFSTEQWGAAQLEVLKAEDVAAFVPSENERLKYERYCEEAARLRAEMAAHEPVTPRQED